VKIFQVIRTNVTVPRNSQAITVILVSKGLQF